MSIISISQAVNDSTPAASTESPGAKQRQQVMRAFAGTMALGLVLATLYVGARIVTSRKSVNSTRPVAKVATPTVHAREAARPVTPPVPPSKPVHEPYASHLPVHR